MTEPKPPPTPETDAPILPQKATTTTEASDADRAEMFSDPPILGTWPRIYGLVLGVLLFQVLVYTWMTFHFS